MKKFLFTILISIFLTSCPICDCHTRISKRQGKLIKEYPDWCAKFDDDGEKCACYGYSDWIDWQSEEGKKLHKFVGDSIVSDNFEGKYRLEISGQGLLVCFNDADSTWAGFFQYIGPYTSYYKDRLVEIDVNSDKVEYDCWFIKKESDRDTDYSDKCSNENSSKVLLEKIDGSKFNYSLIVADKKIIDVEMKNYLNKPQKAIILKSYSWFPTFAFEEVVGKDYWSNGYYGKRSIRFDFDSKDNSVEVWGWGPDSLYCFEGVSLRSVDEENKKILFWLEDRDKSDFADYFEIHITKEDWTDEPKRGADKNNESLMKGTLGFYKIVDGESQVVKFYDEEHSEFSRLVD